MDGQINNTLIGKRYLPLGSVVLLKEGKKELMIYGRKQRDVETKKFFDYAACLYPEGHISKDHIIVFNHESIEKVLFEGLSNDVNKLYEEKVLMTKDEHRINF
ncbi:DUF4176 domain-containing protein [Listeria booriae]|uniref:DUF4176 domain-containing protein n=1 Tax=Listeria booriae TaxID=1552123 RepID=UPI002892BAB3|nr:DUF4176 domain-containing protein [Listeria booriae]